VGGIKLKSADDLKLMRPACVVAAQVLDDVVKVIRPGVTTRQVDNFAGERIAAYGAKSAFLGYRGFPAHCCLSVNEAVIHGIGDRRRLQLGDLVKLDIGVRYLGFVGDVAITLAVGGCTPEAQKLMDVTVQALYEGISAARAGNRIGNIGRAVQTRVEGAGFGVVREFCGHGLGRSVHEDPQVPNYVDRSPGPVLKAGMTIAIEPMVTAGSPEVAVLGDGWTVITRDRRLTAHFEHSVLITDGDPVILTQDDLPALY